MVPGYEYLSVLRITRIMQALSDVRDLPQELKFVNRTEFVPALENEIIGRWINRVQIADLVADDQKALTYSAGKLQIENTVVPNLKHGRLLTQENLNLLAQINANPGLNTQGMGDNEVVGNILPSIVEDLWLGLYQRAEALLVAMHLDSFQYNRFGIQVNGSWGIPSDLKVTLATPWTDPVNGTPVNDIWTLKRNATVRYGRTFNRVWMSTSAFIFMISTAEFQAKARTTLPLFINYTNIPQGNLDFQRNIAQNILGLDELILYDARFWSQDEAGTQTSAPYLPINKVILDSTMNDNNPAVQDWANGVVTESLVSGLLPNTGAGIIGNFQPGMRGPVAYTSVPADMNPPNVTVFGVMRGFPRRFMLQASAVLTVGQFTDQIPVTEPF
jgi:Phage major capsid protein E